MRSRRAKSPAGSFLIFPDCVGVECCTSRARVENKTPTARVGTSACRRAATLCGLHERLCYDCRATNDVIGRRVSATSEMTSAIRIGAFYDVKSVELSLVANLANAAPTSCTIFSALVSLRHPCSSNA